MENEIIIKGNPYESLDFLIAAFQEIDLNKDLPSDLNIRYFVGKKRDYENYVERKEGFSPTLLKSSRLIYAIVRNSNGMDLFSFILRWLPTRETKIALISLSDYDHTSAIWRELINQAYNLGFLDRIPFIENPDQPWNDIPDIRWDRKALKLWWEDLTSKEIGHKLRRKPQTILNRISELRSIHGEELVPKRSSSKKFGKRI